MEWGYFIFYSVVIVTLFLLISILKKHTGGQLVVLILLGFYVGYLVSEGRNMDSGTLLQRFTMPVIFVVGLVYQAVKFYQRIK